MSEAEFQAQVVELARLRGWRTHHHYDSRRSTPGWPDLVMVRRGRMAPRKGLTAEDYVDTPPKGNPPAGDAVTLWFFGRTITKEAVSQ